MTREEKVIALIRSGGLSVDEGGRFWRLTRRRGRGRFLLDAPERADRKDRLGYYRVCGAFAHRVVWTTHNGPIPARLEINHKDGDKSNNHPGNLELATHRENMIHSYTVLGNTCPVLAYGEDNPCCVLGVEKAREARRLSAEGLSQREIGRRLGVSQVTVWKILNNVTYRESV